MSDNSYLLMGIGSGITSIYCFWKHYNQTRLLEQPYYVGKQVKEKLDVNDISEQEITTYLNYKFPAWKNLLPAILCKTEKQD